jgi:hypothetical protein
LYLSRRKFKEDRLKETQRQARAGGAPGLLRSELDRVNRGAPALAHGSAAVAAEAHYSAFAAGTTRKPAVVFPCTLHPRNEPFSIPDKFTVFFVLKPNSLGGDHVSILLLLLIILPQVN